MLTLFWKHNLFLKVREQIERKTKMFALGLSKNEVAKRKRPRESNLTNVKVEYDSDQNLPIDGPLEGVIACLSGFDQGRKEDLHQLIEDLGGR